MNGYNLKRPCPNCPFRNDREPYITGERAEEIAYSLWGGAEFPCHKTTHHDDDGDYMPSKDEQFCAGALIVQELSDGPNQMMRIAERLGMYDPRELDMAAPVYECLEDFIEAHTELA